MDSINVSLLPTLVNADQFRGKTAVVIDVLRATTTIAHALAAGAEKVVPFLNVDDAKNWKANQGRLSSVDVVLGGERGGVKIEGFDFGNSPADYTPARVSGKVVGFTTTNGTSAMQHARAADCLLLASFANLSATVRTLHHHNDVHLLCSGTDGDVTREDALLAGAIVARVCGEHDGVAMNDQARIVRDAWLSIENQQSSSDWLTKAVADSQGGRNLIRLGFDSDIKLAATIDCINNVVQLDLPTWEVRFATTQA